MQYDIRRHRWLGHLLRQPADSFLHQLLYLPTTRKFFVDEYVRPEIEISDARHIAEDRSRWKQRELLLQGRAIRGRKHRQLDSSLERTDGEEKRSRLNHVTSLDNCSS